MHLPSTATLLTLFLSTGASLTLAAPVANADPTPELLSAPSSSTLSTLDTRTNHATVRIQFDTDNGTGEARQREFEADGRKKKLGNGSFKADRARIISKGFTGRCYVTVKEQGKRRATRVKLDEFDESKMLGKKRGATEVRAVKCIS